MTHHHQTNSQICKVLEGAVHAQEEAKGEREDQHGEKCVSIDKKICSSNS